MRIRVANARFILPPLDRHAGLYQYLLSKVSTLRDLGKQLIRDAEVALALRQVRKLDELGSVLFTLPIEEYQLIGQYYRAWCAFHNGESPVRELEDVLIRSRTYKARALISMAALKARDGDYAGEIHHFTESQKYCTDTTTLIKAAKGIAVAKAKQDDHQSALKDLERISHLLRYASLDVYYDCLNSLAVELGAVGRRYEARNIIEPVIASPFAFAYPEWRETAEELKGPNRSFVVIASSPARMGKLLSMPVVEYTEPTKLNRPASVLSLQAWKDKMLKDKDGKNEKLPEDMSGKDMVVKIMNLTTQENVGEKDLRKILDYVRKVLSEPDKD